MKKITLLFLLLTALSFSQTAKIDSLKIVLEETKESEEKAEILLQICKTKQRKDFNNSLKVRYDLLNFSKKENLKNYEYEAYRYLSYFFSRKDLLDSTNYYNNKMYEISKKIDTNKVVSSLLNKGAYFFKLFKPDSSIFYLKKGKNIALRNLKSSTKKDSLKKIEYLMMANTALVKSYFQANKFEIALTETYKNLELAEKYNIHRFDFFNYYYLGMISMELKKYDEALKYYKKEKELAERKNSKNAVGFALIHIGNVYFEKKGDNLTKAIDYYSKANEVFNKSQYKSGIEASIKKKFNVYLITKQYSKAIKEGELYLTLISRKKIDAYLASFYAKLGSAYLMNNKIEKGNYYLNKSINFINTNPKSKIISPLNSLYNAYKITGKNKLALETFEEVVNIRDSLLLNDNFTKKLSEAETKYQTEKKEKENLQLKQEKAEQQLLLEKENQQKWLLGIGLLASLLTLGVFVYYYRKNQQQKQLIESLQKELHHRVKNNLTIINRFVEVIKDEFNNHIFNKKLTELQNRISSINEVHKQLYNSKNVIALGMNAYVNKLTKNVADSFPKQSIKIDKNINENLQLTSTKSFPLGIIINEFVTNSYKYAFNENGGTINITMQENKKHYELQLADNGKGLPTNFNQQTDVNFGLRIIKLLCNQIDATFNLESNNGVQLTIQIPK